MNITNVFKSNNRNGKPDVVSLSNGKGNYQVKLHEDGKMDFNVSRTNILTFQEIINTILLEGESFGIKLKKYI